MKHKEKKITMPMQLVLFAPGALIRPGLPINMKSTIS